jgi:hypothetical protein
MFVWRRVDLDKRPDSCYGHIAWPLDFPKPNLCEVCGEPRVLFRRGRFIPNSSCGIFHVCICPVCGWYYEDHVYPEFYEDKGCLAVLKECDVGAREIILSELGSHLRRRRQDVYYLSPRRFEELVEDVFKNYGFRTVLTAASRDNGADVILLHSDTKEAAAIVECKRYANPRSVGVEIIRCLVGAAVDWKVSRAYLVTSSSFSREAQVKVLDFKNRGIEIELVAMADLVSLLRVYNADLPRLDALTADDRRQIGETRLPALLEQYARKETRSFQQRVQERAYELYIRRGKQPGSDTEDWIRAEQEIRFEDSLDGIPM